MLGAAGAVCGTAFFASEESLAHPAAKQAAVAASGDQTIRGTIFDIVRSLDWPKPWTIRTLENAFFRRWAGEPDLLVQEIKRHRPAYLAAQAAGDMTTAAVIVGEAVVDLVRGVDSAAAILVRIAEGAEIRLRFAHRSLGR
jgi:nitronate monooxygenase